MDLSMISADDWQRFATDYPRATAFLLHASLVGEYRHLRWHVACEAKHHLSYLSDTQRARLDELHTLFTQTQPALAQERISL